MTGTSSGGAGIGAEDAGAEVVEAVRTMAGLLKPCPGPIPQPVAHGPRSGPGGVQGSRAGKGRDGGGTHARSARGGGGGAGPGDGGGRSQGEGGERGERGQRLTGHGWRGGGAAKEGRGGGGCLRRENLT